MLVSKILIGGVFAMLQMHPTAAIPINATSSLPSNMTLERRIINIDSVDCHDEWYQEPAVRTKIALTKPILEGIAYLKQVAGTPKLSPGPKNCDRVSCSDMSAIVWCNEDPDTTKELPSYATIAEAAEIVVSWCQRGKKKKHIKGQVYTQEKWSVILEGDEC